MGSEKEPLGLTSTRLGEETWPWEGEEEEKEEALSAASPRTYRGDIRVGGGHFHQVDEVGLVLPRGVVVVDV